MALNKAKLILIGKLNSLYDKNYSLLQESGGEEQYIKKLKLISHITKKIEIQGRGHSNSKLPYCKAGSFLIANCLNSDYDVLLKKVSEILLEYSRT